tara:strand:+ start:31 stop:225 length:195 start_codon:yes stop_codon:yes gene_type:complete
MKKIIGFKSIILQLVFGFVFYLILTPLSLLLKVLGKDIINLKKNNNNSYWIEKKSSKNTMRNQY